MLFKDSDVERKFFQLFLFDDENDDDEDEEDNNNNTQRGQNADKMDASAENSRSSEKEIVE